MADDGVHVAALAFGGAARMQAGGCQPRLDVDRGSVLVPQQGECGMAQRERGIVRDRLRDTDEGAFLHAQQRADAAVVCRGGGSRRRQRKTVQVVYRLHPTPPPRDPWRESLLNQYTL